MLMFHFTIIHTLLIALNCVNLLTLKRLKRFKRQNGGTFLEIEVMRPFIDGHIIIYYL